MIKVEKSLIIDNGTYEFKCGWCDDEEPSLIKKSTYKNMQITDIEKPTMVKKDGDIVLMQLYKKIKKHVGDMKPDFDILENGKVKFQDGFCEAYDEIIKKMILKKKIDMDEDLSDSKKQKIFEEESRRLFKQNNFGKKNIFDIKDSEDNCFETKPDLHREEHLEYSNLGDTNKTPNFYNSWNGLDFMERIPPILILESMNLDSSSQSKREFINWMFEKMEVSVMGPTHFGSLSQNLKRRIFKSS
jgi:hypothetical protein